MTNTIRTSHVPAIATRSSSAVAERGADVALRSLGGLQQTREEPGLLDKMRRGVVVALIGLTTLTAFSPPAHADTANTVAPQTTEWFEPFPTGPPALDLASGASSTALRGFVAQQQQLQANAVPSATQARVDAATTQAFDAFQAKLTAILHRDAASLASGLRPIAPGDPLDAASQQQLEGAFRDLVSSLPLSALSPHAANVVSGALDGAGLDHPDLATTRLRDLGHVGGQAARQLVDRLKQDSPAAYWTMAGAAAGAAVVVGYTQGTDALARLGVKPQFSTGVFHDAARVQVGLHTGPHLADPRVNVGVSGQHDLGNGWTARGRVDAEFGGQGVRGLSPTGARLQASVANATTSIAGDVKLDGHGHAFDARLSATHTWQHASGQATASGAAAWTREQGTTLSASVAGTHRAWTYAAASEYRVDDARLSATVSAGRQFSISRANDAEIQVRGRIDNRGDRFVGVGATWRF